MPPNSIHVERTRTLRKIIRGLAVGLALLTRTASAQSPPLFIVYDDGLTRTNVGTTDSQIILRDHPNPPPNPTTVILLDGFSLGPSGQYHYRLEGSSVLDIRGGMVTNGGGVGSVDMYNDSRLLMSGGSIRHQSEESLDDPAIRAGGSSRTEISGGSLAVSSSAEGRSSPGIGLRDNAVLSISGGEFTAVSTAIIESEGASHVTISDGTFDAFGSGANEFIGNILTAYESSVVDILGGTFTSDEFAFQDGRGIDAVGNATVNIRGGSFSFPFDMKTLSGFHGAGNGRINVFGDSFALDGSPVAPGFIPRNGRLTGVLADGTPLDVLATGRVFLIPEPAAAWLLPAVALTIMLVDGGRRGEAPQSVIVVR